MIVDNECVCCEDTLPKGTQLQKLRGNHLFCDTLTVHLEGITELTFDRFGNFTGQADFTIIKTTPGILGEVMVTNSVKAIVNNTVALLIVFHRKFLREFDGIEKVSDVHTIGTL
jgi:hypothetical protein